MNQILGGVTQMAKVVTENTIRGWIHKGEIIQNGDVNYAEGIKYDFTLGNKF